MSLHVGTADSCKEVFLKYRVKWIICKMFFSHFRSRVISLSVIYFCTSDAWEEGTIVQYEWISSKCLFNGLTHALKWENIIPKRIMFTVDLKGSVGSNSAYPDKWVQRICLHIDKWSLSQFLYRCRHCSKGLDDTSKGLEMGRTIRLVRTKFTGIE